MNKNIRISTIVNYFNGQKYLHKCIECILNKEYQNFDLVIKIIKHSNFNQKIKFLISFFFPTKLIKLLRK